MSDPIDKHLDEAIASLDELTARELEATAEALASRRHPLHEFSSIFRNVAGARGESWDADLPRFHLGQAVSRADGEFAARIADASAPFWAQCAMRWPSGIRNSGRLSATFRLQFAARSRAVFAQPSLLLSERTALAGAYRDGQVGWLIDTDDLLALVARRIERAAVTVAGALEAHEPVLAGVDAEYGLGDERRAVSRRFGKPLFEELVPTRAFDADVRVRTFEVGAL